MAVATALPGWVPAGAQPAGPALAATTAATPLRAKPARGALRIRITGLPTGVRPAVRVTGPGRFTKKVRRTRTLRRLTPGVYRVATPRVSKPDGAATGQPSKRRVRVRAGRTARVAARYAWTAAPPLAPAPATPPPTTAPPTTPPDTTAPGPVTALTAAERTPESIRLTWTNPTDPDLASVIVRRAKGPTAPATPSDGTAIPIGAPTATTVTDTGLDPGTTYSYAAFARDTTGNTSPATTLTTATTTPPDTTAPGPVTALTAAERTPESIRLTWTNPTDPDLATIIVRRAKGPTAPATPTDGTAIPIDPPTATTVTDTGLDPSTTYSYAAFARDTTGNTSPATTLTTATTAAPRVYSVFNYPQPGAPDLAISDELVRRLDQVPAGAQIEAAFYIITPDYSVVDALLAAHDRGASVQVVLDSGDRLAQSGNDLVDATFQRLREALGGDTSAGSFAMQCEVAACISQEDDSIQHNKFVLMSRSGDLNDVVFQTTGNMRTGGSGDAAWNAAVVSSGDAGLFGSFRDYFADLAARISVPGNNYHAVRPPTTYGKFTPYYFPRTDGVDTVSQTLGSLDCGTGPAVDVMATHLVRTEVGERLNQMAQSGCQVRVISRPDNITRQMCESLEGQGVVVRIGEEPTATKVGIHAKYLTISGGTNDQHLVWMGSHNFTINALLRNDETFVMIDDQGVTTDFRTNFQTIWNDPTVTPGCTKAP